MLKHNTRVFLLVFSCYIFDVHTTPSHRIPTYETEICNDNKNITSQITPALHLGYTVVINKHFPAATEIRVKLDSGGAVHVDLARSITDKDLINNVFTFILLQDINLVSFTINGRSSPEHPPYILSLKINGEENCKEPNRTYFDNYYDYVGTAPLWPSAPDRFCGRRRINRRYTGLIVSGPESKSGEWPWHSAIYRLIKNTLQYICGGTLISKFSVLTAAHCATINGAALNPSSLGVILGKYKLIGSEATMQDKNVLEVLVHDEFDHRTLNNDIAILKLGSEVSFNNYVQPACLWLDAAYDQIDSYEINGMVVGWGIDQTQTLSNTLRETLTPIVPDITCIRYDPIFYTNALSGKKFCGGLHNGSVACNGDSGGGLAVFVPDIKKLTGYYENFTRPGAWYVKGIVSATLLRQDELVCDPNAYTVFTDVAKYRDWIFSKM